MVLTAEQRIDRHKYLGSSDVPAIMGMSRFSNAYDVWLEKTQRVEPREISTGPAAAGTRFEDGVLDWFAETVKVDIIREDEKHDMTRRVPETVIKVHLDGQVQDTLCPVEVKTEGLYGPIIEPWGDDGTDEVPEYTFIQAHCHMMATDTELCHVPTFLGGRGFNYFFVPRDKVICDLIREQAVKFWADHVLKDTPPDATPHLEVARRIRRIEGDPVELPDELVENWLNARETAKEAAERVEFYKADILATLDGRSIGTSSASNVTNFTQKRRGYTVAATEFEVLRDTKKTVEEILGKK